MGGETTKCPRAHPCECRCIREDPLSPITSGGFYEFGALMDAWPHCPGPKVEKMFLYTSFLTTDWEINSYIVRLFRIIPERLFSLVGFVDSVRLGIN